jgi:hypothetical protein
MSTKDNHVNQSDDLDRYLNYLYGDRRFYIQVCSLDPTKPKAEAWDEGKPVAYLPGDIDYVARTIRQIAASGHNAYVSAHGYLDSRRGGVSVNAAPIDTLWIDGDDAPIPTGDLRPPMIVETSPGRWQGYLKLTRAIPPHEAADLNRRYTALVGGDSGWGLTKRLRPPETRNLKYPDAPQVRLRELDEARRFDPDELDRILPKLPPTPKVLVDNINKVDGDTDNEPPVVLSLTALAVWRGEKPVLKPNGEIDRSESLYKIGVVLHEHNATRPTIIAALAERDTALGWNRYSDVPHEYGRIAAKVAPKPRLSGPIGTPAPTTGPPSVGHCAGCADKTLIISGLIQTVLSPNLTLAEKIALVSVLTLAEKKRQDNDLGGDGLAEIDSAEVANDYRPTPDKGESVAPTNKDGSKPRMSRDKVKPVMRTLVDRGFLSATPRAVMRTRANGARYRDEVWDVTPTNMAESLALAATWGPETPTPRKPRTSRGICPHCNELHPIHRQDTCTGCGTIRSTTIIQPDLEADAGDTIAETAPATVEPPLVRKFSGQVVNTAPVVVGDSLVRIISGQGDAADAPTTTHTAPTLTPTAPVVISEPIPAPQPGMRGRGHLLNSLRNPDYLAREHVTGGRP